jgi:hypothetical protein
MDYNRPLVMPFWATTSTRFNDFFELIFNFCHWVWVSWVVGFFKLVPEQFKLITMDILLADGLNKPEKPAKPEPFGRRHPPQKLLFVTHAPVGTPVRSFVRDILCRILKIVS